MNLAKISLQARITLLVLITMLLFGLVAGYESYKNALHEADELFDAQLAQSAQSLLLVASISDGDDEMTEAMPPLVHKYQQMLSFQVWNTNKEYPRILLRSDNVSGMTKSQLPPEGFSSGMWQGEHWRYFRQREEHRGLDVLVGERDQARHNLAQEVAWHTVAPFLFGIPILGLLILWAIYFSLHPLRKLTDVLAQLTPEQLTPVELKDAPQEIVPVVTALNSLLRRIATTIENERRFTADASHELRTPLAALQAQVQAAQLCDDEVERNECLIKAMQGTERMGHLVGQLLTLSRLDEETTAIQLNEVNLNQLIQEGCAALGINALTKNIEISYISAIHPVFHGSADMLRILIRNLLDNAIRYTPQGGRVEVALHVTDKQIEFDVSDSGIGIANEKLTQLGQRFNRISPHVSDGVGLGLSIVLRIAEIHHAQVTFERSGTLGGLSVKIRFPIA